MTDPELEAKRQKARRYATQPERFALEHVILRMRSEHGERRISYADGRWTCTCPFYHERGICSHIMAAQTMFSALLKSGSDADNAQETPE